MNNSVRVLFVEVTTGKGGSAGCLVRMIPNLRVRGILPTVLAYKVGGKLSTLAADGIPVIDLRRSGTVPPDPFIYRFGVPFPTAAFFSICYQVCKAILKVNPDVVYLNTRVYAQFPAFIAAKLMRRKVICHLRENDAPTTLERLALPHLDGAIALSDAAVQHYVRSGVPQEKITRVYDGLDLPTIDGALSSTQDLHDSSTFTLVTIGALIPLKGHRFLLEAMKLLSDKIPDLRLLIAGDGPLREELELFCENAKIKAAVTFLGYCNNVPALLKQSDACVMPSLQEGFPQVALETMAARKPLIISRLPGLDELIDHERTGLLVPTRSPAALANAIETLAANRNLAEQMGLRGRAVLESRGLTPEAEADAIKRVITQVIEDSNHS
jgi:glycosyltransferase involved in cell wall biosynthesis